MNCQTIRKEICRTFIQGISLYGLTAGIGGKAVKILGGKASFDSGFLMGMLQPIVNKIVEISLRKIMFEKNEDNDGPTTLTMYTVSWLISAGLASAFTKQLDRKSIFGIEAIMLSIIGAASMLIKKQNDHFAAQFLFPVHFYPSYFKEA